MTRIPASTSIDAAPESSQPRLQAIKQQIGMTNNLFRIVTGSLQTLEAYLGLNRALDQGALSARIRERTALVVDDINEVRR